MQKQQTTSVKVHTPLDGFVLGTDSSECLVLQDVWSVIFSGKNELRAAETEEDEVGAAPADEVGAAPADEVGATRRSRSAHCLHQATKKVASDCSGAAVDY